MKADSTKDHRSLYLASLASDIRFKTHVLEWLEKQKKEHLARVTSRKSEVDDIRFSQGGLEVIERLENLFRAAERNISKEETHGRSTD